MLRRQRMLIIVLTGSIALVPLRLSPGHVAMSPPAAAAQVLQASAEDAADAEPDTPPAARLFVTSGVGFIDTEHYVGANVPLGFHLLLNRYRLLLGARFLDIAMTEGERDDRYYWFRPYPGYTYSICVDAETGYRVADFYCTGGTRFSVSSSADLSYILLREVWFSDQPGQVTVGAGFRYDKPRTPYLTLGVYFPHRSTRLAGARLDLGSNLIHLGMVWGLDVIRVVRR